MVTFRSILITGASSGIGAALAIEFAGPEISLLLTGRNEARLDAIAGQCRARGAEVAALVLDVTDRTAMADAILRFDTRTPIDLVVANAGISAGTARGETADQVNRINAVNIDGILNTIQPLIPRMQERGRGHIALVSSLAGFRGMPGAPAYAASKGWAKLYGEGLRGSLKPSGIGISVICPGFVESRITAANDFTMPFLMSAERAARIIRKGLESNRARIAFPWPTYFAVRLLSIIPPAWTDRLLTALPAKGGGDQIN